MAVLYVVATPIGNLGDITVRALDTLRAVDVIACEDTRRTRTLLVHHGITTRTVAYGHDETRSGRVLGLLRSGLQVALVSDAGTPGISDPGGGAVRAAREAGFAVVPIPGASAVTALLSVAGTSAQGVRFHGFCSPKPGRRRAQLERLLADGAPFVLFEGPHRVLKLLGALAEAAPERSIVLGRELTKLHEEVLVGTATALCDELASRARIAGELTLLVTGNRPRRGAAAPERGARTARPVTQGEAGMKLE
ncbi:MAG: 16S rRNA (cytidine(1402)-2'-O)-methyltransferase [Spirochaetaceae bacterium]|nr:16S rRNA (cytidine(1402)-2'-O)-methyltransferase [Spirochaetaceae bacterium]